MKRLLTLATVLVAAVCMNAGAMLAEVTNLVFTNSYFENNTNITETAWSKKNINFMGFTADKSWRANVKINTNHVAGSYTLADCSDYQVYLTDLSSYDSYYATSADLVVTEDDNAVTLTADMTTNNGDFHFVITCVKQESIDINIGSLSIYDYGKPSYSISGKGSDYEISLTLVSTAADESLADGEYSIGEYSNIYVKAYYSTVYLTTDSKVTVTNTTSWNGEPCVNITGEVMGQNGQKYNLTLTSGLPMPDKMLELNSSSAVVVPEFRENGRWSMDAQSENIKLSMQLAKEDYAGTYDMKKWNFGYNNTVTVDGVAMDLDDAHIVVTDLGTEVNAKGWVIASNAGKVYYVAVDITGEKGVEPAASGDCTEAMPGLSFTNYEISSDWMWGGWVIDSQNNEGYFLHLVSGTYYEGGDIPTGEYTVTNDWDVDLRITPSTFMDNGGPGPLRAGAAGATPNGSYITDANGNYWFIYKGKVNVAYESGKLVVECECVNTAAQDVNFAVGENAKVPTAISNVTVDNDVKVIKFISNGKMVIKANGIAYGVDGKMINE